jgi:hypothetical protein
VVKLVVGVDLGFLEGLLASIGRVGAGLRRRRRCFGDGFVGLAFGFAAGPSNNSEPVESGALEGFRSLGGGGCGGVVGVGRSSAERCGVAVGSGLDLRDGGRCGSRHRFGGVWSDSAGWCIGSWRHDFGNLEELVLDGSVGLVLGGIVGLV